MQEKAIYKMTLDIRRMGILEGIFIANKKDVKKLIDDKTKIYFGEVLGKHSEIFGNIEKEEIIEITDDPIAIEIFEKYNFTSGYNPFDYIEN